MVTLSSAARVAVDLEKAFEDIDLEGRIAAVPADAKVRGVFFQMIDAALRRHHLTALPIWSRSQPPRHTFQLYSVHEYLRTFATAAALINPDPREGMADIFSDGSRFFASTWFGRALHQFIRPDPVPALRWIERSRDHLANYGRWRVEERGRGHAVLHMFGEYIWIEHAHRGGCEGLLVACGLKGTVEVSLDGPFDGRLDIEWDAR